MKELLFDYLCTIHILFWVFVIFAFIDVNYAKLNFFYVIPFVYFLHIFPFHILEETKKNIYKKDYEEKRDSFYEHAFVGPLIRFQKKLGDLCFCSPLSPQGMLILGALTSGYSIMYHNKIKLFEL